MNNPTGARPLYDPAIRIQIDTFKDYHIVRVIKKLNYFGGRELQRYRLHGGEKALNQLVVEFIEEKKKEFNVDPSHVKVINHIKLFKG